jgi:glutaredoxin 2
MALGFLGLPWKSQVLRYDDETTPLKLAGQKMLPIARIDGAAMNESLDIIQKLDVNNRLPSQDFTALDPILTELGGLVHSLAMPYWVWTPEFDEASRQYFIKKKSGKRGPFPELAKRRLEFEVPLQKRLKEFEQHLTPYWDSQHLTLKDIALAAHLWGLFVVPEFRLSDTWYNYLMKIKTECQFNYHADFWEQAWS